MDTSIRIGYGFDIHRWADDRRLVLGGVEIPHDQGLLGHSDADALTHAVIDALLGAVALGDIGQHFPDTDPRFKDIDSMELLKRTMILIHDTGHKVCNVDSTIVTDAPKLAPYILRIRRNLAKGLYVKEEQVSVKATRTEGVFYTENKGLIAMSTLLLIKP